MEKDFDPNSIRKIPRITPVRGFGDNRQLNSIQLIITTYCDRMCPGCVCNIPYLKNHQHVDINWIKEISQKLQGLRLLQISGGEPTLHPKFKYITEHIREWFNPQMLMLVTNGKNIIKYADILGYYDYISITHYNKLSYPGSVDNFKTIRDFRGIFKGPSVVKSETVKHVLNREGKNIWPCGLGANDVALIQWGKMYPCCIAAGRAPKSGIEITENWREELKNVKLPCKGCPFALSKEMYQCLLLTLEEGDFEQKVEQKKYKEACKTNESRIHKTIKKVGYDKWEKQLKEQLIGIDKDTYKEEK